MLTQKIIIVVKVIIPILHQENDVVMSHLNSVWNFSVATTRWKWQIPPMCSDLIGDQWHHQLTPFWYKVDEKWTKPSPCVKKAACQKLLILGWHGVEFCLFLVLYVTTFWFYWHEKLNLIHLSLSNACIIVDEPVPFRSLKSYSFELVQYSNGWLP